MAGGTSTGGWRGLLGVLALCPFVGLACFVSIPSPETTGSAADAGHDAGDAMDSGAEASVDAATGSWCSQNAADAGFCADFDEPSALSAFTGTDQMGGTLQIVSADASSPPSALVASSAGPGQLGIWAESFGPSASTATLSADVRLDKVNDQNDSDAYVTSLVFQGLSTSYQVGVGINGTSHTALVYAFDSASMTNQSVVAVGPVFPLGAWTHVTLRVTLATGGSTVDVQVGSDVVATKATLNATLTSGTAQLFVGLPFAAANNDGWTVAIDNVVFDSAAAP